MFHVKTKHEVDVKKTLVDVSPTLAVNAKTTLAFEVMVTFLVDVNSAFAFVTVQH